MKNNPLRNFLSKVLTSQEMTEELRKEALEFRDSLDTLSRIKSNVAVVDLCYEENVSFGGVNYSLNTLKECAEKAKTHPEEILGKIAFIQQIRREYGMGLKDSKDLSDHLVELGHFSH